MVSHYALTSFFREGEVKREEKERLHHKWSIVRYHLPEWDDDDERAKEGGRERWVVVAAAAAAATPPLHPIYLSRLTCRGGGSEGSGFYAAAYLSFSAEALWLDWRK